MLFTFSTHFLHWILACEIVHEPYEFFLSRRHANRVSFDRCSTYAITPTLGRMGEPIRLRLPAVPRRSSRGHPGSTSISYPRFSIVPHNRRLFHFLSLSSSLSSADRQLPRLVLSVFVGSSVNSCAAEP